MKFNPDDFRVREGDEVQLRKWPTTAPAATPKAASSSSRWLRVKPPHGVTFREAKRFDQQYCLFARQCRPAPVADEAGAIALNDVIELGAAAFIRFRHYVHMVSQRASANREGRVRRSRTCAVGAAPESKARTCSCGSSSRSAH